MHCKLSDFWQKTRSALGLPSDNFQSSLRDFSSLEFLPRTASWAKFSRPCGTHSAIVRFSRRLFSTCSRGILPEILCPEIIPDGKSRRLKPGFLLDLCGPTRVVP